MFNPEQQLRLQSKNQYHRPQRYKPPVSEPSVESIPIPDDVWNQFEAARGSAGSYLPLIYNDNQLKYWYSKWLYFSWIGAEVRHEIKSKINHAVGDKERKEKEDLEKYHIAAAHRLEQENYKVEPGSIIKVMQDKSRLHGVHGVVNSCYWRGDELFCNVTVNLDNPLVTQQTKRLSRPVIGRFYSCDFAASALQLVEGLPQETDDNEQQSGMVRELECNETTVYPASSC